MRHYVVNLYSTAGLVYGRGGPARNRRHALRLAMRAYYARRDVTYATIDLDGDARTRRTYRV